MCADAAVISSRQESPRFGASRHPAVTLAPEKSWKPASELPAGIGEWGRERCQVVALSTGWLSGNGGIFDPVCRSDALVLVCCALTEFDGDEFVALVGRAEFKREVVE